MQWNLHRCNGGDSPKIVLPPCVLCISRSYMTFHAINLTFRQNAVIFKLEQKKQSIGGNILNQPIEWYQKPRKRKDCIMLIHMEVYCFSVFCNERVWEPMKSICKLLSLSFVTKQKYSKSPLKIQTIHFHNLMRRPNCTFSM